MTAALPLRIASILTFIHAVLHTVGGVFGKVPPGPAAVAALAMQTNQFVALGVTRTFWQYYRGMGLAVTIFLTAEAIVFWQLSNLAKANAPRLRPIFATFFLAYLVFAIDSYLYFFSAPVITEVLIALCFAWALFAAKPAATA